MIGLVVVELEEEVMTDGCIGAGVDALEELKEDEDELEEEVDELEDGFFIKS